MGNYIDEMFKRVNLQKIQSYLKDGGELFKTSSLSYLERLQQAEKPLTKALDKAALDKRTQIQLKEAALLTWGKKEDIYMELGIKLGAILQRQLMD